MIRSGMAENAPTPLEMRSCGTCVACCVTPRIATSELTKDPNTACAHCTGSGCGIYDARPPVCRDYLCLWRQTAEMDDSWRPDRSGVILFSAVHACVSRLPATVTSKATS